MHMFTTMYFAALVLEIREKHEVIMRGIYRWINSM